MYVVVVSTCCSVKYHLQHLTAVLQCIYMYVSFTYWVNCVLLKKKKKHFEIVETVKENIGCDIYKQQCKVTVCFNC